jgi:hypothetical protein
VILVRSVLNKTIAEPIPCEGSASFTARSQARYPSVGCSRWRPNCGVPLFTSSRLHVKSLDPPTAVLARSRSRQSRAPSPAKAVTDFDRPLSKGPLQGLVPRLTPLPSCRVNSRGTPQFKAQPSPRRITGFADLNCAPHHFFCLQIRGYCVCTRSETGNST